jgi:hypothetical protein
MKPLKKRATAAFTTLVIASSAMAQSGEIKVDLDGAPFTTSVPPLQMSGRVLLPLRDIFEPLGATVQWNAATQSITATKDAMTLNLRMNSRAASLNGRSVTLDQPPAMVRGRIMLPLRFVSEALGADVNWNPVSRRVSISTGIQLSTIIQSLPGNDSASIAVPTTPPAQTPPQPAPSQSATPPRKAPPKSPSSDDLDDLLKSL